MKSTILNNEHISVVISTKKIDDNYLKHIKKFFGNPKTEFLIYVNNGNYSLTEIYNKGLNESKNNIVVFMHDDIILETNNLSKKISQLINNNLNYGIIGIAGTDKLTSGTWWENKENLYGKVGHIYNNKRHVTIFSKNEYNTKLKDVIVVDGLFFIMNKEKIKKQFNEDFKGFHFYDIVFCFENYLENVKIGLTTKIKLTHKSVGMTDENWEKNKSQFEEKFNKQINSINNEYL